MIRAVLALIVLLAAFLSMRRLGSIAKLVVLGGAVADLFGYGFVFGTSLGFLGAAMLILLLAVREPRRRLAA